MTARAKPFTNVSTWVIALAVFGVAGPAEAGLSKKVQKTFKGQILITDSKLDLEAEGTDAETIRYCKKKQAKVIKGSDDAEGVYTWSFHYTAFFKSKPKVSTLSFDFYTDDKERLYVANKKIAGVDALLTLQGQIKISEDDNLNRNRSYVIKLTGEVKGKEVVYATTKIKTR